MIPVLIVACWSVVVFLVVVLCIAAQRGDIAQRREVLARDASASSGSAQRPALGSIALPTAARAAVRPTARARRSKRAGPVRVGPSSR